MKRTYIIPTTVATVLAPCAHLLSASDTPDTTIGEGKKSVFDVKDGASAPSSFNVWSDDWSK